MPGLILVMFAVLTINLDQAAGPDRVLTKAEAKAHIEKVISERKAEYKVND